MILPSKGQGQYRVIILIYSTVHVLINPVLYTYTMFQGHRSFGSGEEDFKVFYIYGYGGQVSRMTTTIFDPRPLEDLFEIWFELPSGCFMNGHGEKSITRGSSE